MFKIISDKEDIETLFHQYMKDEVGAVVTFDGFVRDINDGKKVESLEYEVYHELALLEGNKIIEEAKSKFKIINIFSIHREGHLQIGEKAFVVMAFSRHRKDAFNACEYVVEQVKCRVPIWKKEHYKEGVSEWIFCPTLKI